jgi:hypothetical protein
MSIKYPAATSDCLAFESSQLYEDLEKGLLAEGLCIFGDNAYINSPFVATPYPNVPGGYKDAYNFFHLQLQIRVECAFGMFVQRWGVLRSALPCGVSIQKTISLVVWHLASYTIFASIKQTLQFFQQHQWINVA